MPAVTMKPSVRGSRALPSSFPCLPPLACAAGCGSWPEGTAAGSTVRCSQARRQGDVRHVASTDTETGVHQNRRLPAGPEGFLWLRFTWRGTYQAAMDERALSELLACAGDTRRESLVSRRESVQARSRARRARSEAR